MQAFNAGQLFDTAGHIGALHREFPDIGHSLHEMRQDNKEYQKYANLPASKENQETIWRIMTDMRNRNPEYKALTVRRERVLLKQNAAIGRYILDYYGNIQRLLPIEKVIPASDMRDLANDPDAKFKQDECAVISRRISELRVKYLEKKYND